MRGSTKKLITEWATKSWDATSEQGRQEFGTIHYYIERLKNEWKTNKKFQEFIKSV